MNNRFDYKESLNNIKASLFDIYEDQEQLIGVEKNQANQERRLNHFVEVKNIALMLIEGIEDLYHENSEKNYSTNQENITPKISIEMEDSKLDDLVVNSEMEGINLGNIENTKIEETNDEFMEEASDLEEEETEPLKKFYLNCEEENVNFAYVPANVYEKIKENVNSLEDHSEVEESDFDEEEDDFEEETEDVMSDGEIDSDDSDESFDDDKEDDDSSLYKQDEEKPRGIIVRNDQYMKLALSKHRQKNVLEEAKLFRIEAVKRKRREDQKKELENAKVNLDL